MRQTLCPRASCVRQVIHPPSLARLIAGSPDIAEFGRLCRDGCSEMQVSHAESLLNYRFSRSYRWFLKTYGWGFLDHDEIFTLSEDFEDGLPIGGINASGETSVWSADPETVMVSQQLAVNVTSAGEVFFFDHEYSRFGERTVYCLTAEGEMYHYASDFYEFLFKRLHFLRNGTKNRIE